MAESKEITVDRKLGDIFKEGFDIFNGFQTTTSKFNSAEYQNSVKKCISLFEDATRLVSLLGMFSTNEMLEEIPSNHLKYLLLPFYLAQLTTKSTANDREQTLKVAEVYYKDFLKRCEEYGICQQSTVEHKIVNENDKMKDLIQMAGRRNEKLEQYRIKKTLEEEIKMLANDVEKEHVDDEIKRDFYLKLIKFGIIESRDELKSIEQELEILVFRNACELNDKNANVKHVHKKLPMQPLKPVIITRDAAQKAVFGMGYPSLPVMSVSEFYDQRVREGIFPDQEQIEKINKIGKPDQSQMDEKEELDKEQNELLAEIDDEEYINRQRAMDEYKDIVRRGDGNRYNRS